MAVDAALSAEKSTPDAGFWSFSARLSKSCEPMTPKPTTPTADMPNRGARRLVGGSAEDAAP